MIQIVRCKCCGQVFAACMEPDCHTEDGWLKNLIEYKKRGDTVEMAERGSFYLDVCQCKVVSGYAILFDTPYTHGSVFTQSSFDVKSFEKMKNNGDIIDYFIDNIGVKISKKAN